MFLIEEKYPWIKDEVELVKSILNDACVTSSANIRNELTSKMEQDDSLLRAELVLLASRFGTYNSEDILNLAAVVEMLYYASQLQVDGFMSCGNKDNKASFLNKSFAGNYLYVESMQLMSEKLNPDEVKIIMKCFKKLVKSEYIHLSQRYVLHRSKRAYLRHIEARSGAIFEMCFQIGAIQSRSSRQIVHILQRIGYHLGMANQLIEDLLDIDHDEEIRGKTLGINIKEGVYPLSIYYLYRVLPEETKKLLSKKPIRDKHIIKLIELMNQYGAVEKMRTLAQMYTRKVYLEINLLPQSEYKQVAFDVASHLLERRY